MKRTALPPAALHLAPAPGTRRAFMGLVVALAALAASPAAAHPILNEPERIAGLRIYPDHRDGSLFWYVRDRLDLAAGDGAPAFSFERFRYKGNAATGDSEVFWARGVLSFAVRFDVPPGALAAAERALAGGVRRPVTLRPLPLERVESELIYVAAGDEEEHGVLPPGRWRGEPGLWRERTYQLGLGRRTTELLWRAYHLGGVALSLNYEVFGRGLAARPDPREEGREDEMMAAPAAAGAIPIRVSPVACPACFTSSDLDARIPAGYTRLDVFCHDFLTGAAPADLAMVRVEVRATAVDGERPRQQLRFVPGGPARQEMRFKFAVRLDAGYELRAVRLFADGRSEAGAWRRVDSWIGIQDVTFYTAAEGPTALDPRNLY